MFYLLGRLVHKIRKDDEDFAFTALILISIPIGLNVLSVMMLLNGIEYRASKQTNFFLALFIFVPIVAINYFLLMRNNNHEKIMSYFREKYKDTNHSFLVILLIVIYIIASISLCVYLAQQNRALHG